MMVRPIDPNEYSVSADFITIGNSSDKDEIETNGVTTIQCLADKSKQRYLLFFKTLPYMLRSFPFAMTIKFYTYLLACVIVAHDYRSFLNPKYDKASATQSPYRLL
jgi:hypothetical protein